jgi:heptosyltransferase-3
MFTIPSIRAIREANPDATIDVLAHPNRYEVLKNLPLINNIGKITKKSAKFFAFFASKKYDYALVYWHDKPLIKYALKVADRVVAFDQDDSELNAKLYKVVQKPEFHKEHAIQDALSLPNALGFTTQNLRTEFHPTKQELHFAYKFLKLHNLDGANPLIGLQVASFHTASYRDWPIEHFYELCKKVLQDYPNAKFLLFGGKVERNTTETLAQKLDTKAFNAAGKLTLRETASIMSKIDAYVGVDTGPTHIMSSFNVPMVAMYHANSLAKHTGVLQHPNAFLIDHPKGEVLDINISMSEISVDLVYENLIKALNSKK